MSFVKLASIPLARAAQVAADGTTGRFNVDTNELQLRTQTELAAYYLLENLTNYNMRYFYQTGDYLNGFTLQPKCAIRIVVRDSIFVQLEAGSGEGCFDRADG
jgi:hypothetical protein